MSNSILSKSFPKKPFLLPREESKPRTLQVRAYKYLKNLEVDPPYVNLIKNKKKYVKTFFSSKVRTSNHFEKTFSLRLLKKQRKLNSLVDAYGQSIYIFAKILKRKKVSKVIIPYLQADNEFLETFKKSSQLRKSLTDVGILLKAERPGEDYSSALFQLYRCHDLSGLSLFCFSSKNPLKEKVITQGFKFKALKSFRTMFLWMSRTLLANICTILSNNPSLAELSINSVEWKHTGKIEEFETFLQALTSLKCLRNLKLSNISVDTEYKNMLLDSISQLKNIKYLALDLKIFTTQQYPHLKNLFEQLKELKDLRLEFESMELAPEFFQHLSIIKHLKHIHLKVSFDEDLGPSLPDIKNFFKAHPFLEGFSFQAFQTPNIQEDSFDSFVSLLALCPNLHYLEFNIRKFAGLNLQTKAFQSLSQTLDKLNNLDELVLNFHLWYPVEVDLSDLSKALTRLTKLKSLTIQLPLIKDKSTQTIKMLLNDITTLKVLRLLKIEFCYDEPISIESQVFELLMERLPKLKDCSIWYHNINKTNTEVVPPYTHFEKIAIEKYQLSSFILANVLIYTNLDTSESEVD